MSQPLIELRGATKRFAKHRGGIPTAVKNLNSSIGLRSDKCW
jgi:hypothetical protein